MNKLIFTFALFSTLQSVAQTIRMEFPAFAGKTYDFILFQGSKAEKVIQDTIPPNGKFKLSIPAKYAPYTGMCRWLLTNSEFGGGIDMAIPGYDFSITCLSDKPDNTNIIYTGFDAVNELNRLNSEQQKIIDRFETMVKAINLYDTSHPLYPTFQKEKQVQMKAYETFREDLKKNPNYNARFLPIVSLVNGYAHRLSENENDKGLLFNEYFTQKMSFEDLYVSGHWDGIIQSWVMLQINVIANKNAFAQDFKAISDRILKPAHYTDFAGKVTFYLAQYSKDDYIEAIAQTVVGSGKITSYEGKTMQVYVNAMVGMQAPDVVVKKASETTANTATQILLKSKDFAQGKMQKTLLVFYQSGCGPCEVLLAQLPSKYTDLKNKGIDIIAISGDESREIFEQTSKNFPWPRTYCDFEGLNGANWKNYAVIGTPTLFLVDANGTIISKLSSMEQLNNMLSN